MQKTIFFPRIKYNFMDRFTYSIFKTSVDNRLIEEKDRIVISFSGGVDSMSLFCLLQAFQEKIDIDLHLVHFHHGLRAESDEEAEFVTATAKKRSVPVTIYRATHLKDAAGVQNRARQWRYRRLKETMKELGFDKIALGHQLGDLIETQIWRMLRGGSLFAFNPMQISALPYIRPLLHTSKEDLCVYLQRIGQPWKEDKTNQNDNYTRNMIRNRLLPIMKDCSGGKLEEKFLALNKDAYLLKGFFREMVPAKRYRQKELSYGSISKLNPVFAKELIHQYLLYHNQVEISRASIDKIYRLVTCNRGGWLVCLKKGVAVQGKSKKISLIRQNVYPVNA